MAGILVIDDDIQIRNMLKAILEREGHRVALAYEGEEGLRKCRESRPDLVITDLIMPGKEGIETIKEMKRGFPGILIIAMSGGGRNRPEVYLDLAGAIGAVRTFAKPIRKDELLAVVREVLDLRTDATVQTI